MKTSEGESESDIPAEGVAHISPSTSRACPWREASGRTSTASASGANSTHGYTALGVHGNFRLILSIRCCGRYALDVNAERAEDVLVHMQLLDRAKHSDNQPAFSVRLVQVPSD